MMADLEPSSELYNPERNGLYTSHEKLRLPNQSRMNVPGRTSLTPAAFVVFLPVLIHGRAVHHGMKHTALLKSPQPAGELVVRACQDLRRMTKNGLGRCFVEPSNLLKGSL